jgi:hypothetical protein
LRLSFAPHEWQFRVSHYGLFLGFAIVFSFHSTTFLGMISFVVVLMLTAIVVLQTLIFALLGQQDEWHSWFVAR